MHLEGRIMWEQSSAEESLVENVQEKWHHQEDIIERRKSSQRKKMLVFFHILKRPTFSRYKKDT